MAVVQLITLGLQITDDPNYTAADRWDGYVCPVIRDFPEGPFQGYQLNWGTYETENLPVTYLDQPYVGYNTNWGKHETEGMLNGFINQNYVGYSTNWGKFEPSLQRSINNVDEDNIIDHPKDQKVYFKLKGWNPLTSEYESWIISQNITGRPSLDGGLFDPIPGREPPNVERDVFKTPPSGNNLTNIIIVARWFE